MCMYVYIYTESEIYKVVYRNITCICDVCNSVIDFIYVLMLGVIKHLRAVY